MLYTFDQIRGKTGRWSLHIDGQPCADGSHLRSTNGKKYEISSGDFHVWSDFTLTANSGGWQYQRVSEPTKLPELTAVEAVKHDGTYQCIGDASWSIVVLDGKAWWYGPKGKHSLVQDPSNVAMRFRRVDVTKAHEVPKLNIKRTRLLLCDILRPR